jgi:pimeloyl-ACP methyl ester carboxylesterase
MLWVEDRGSGPAIVLLHNGVMDSRQWDPQLPSFTRSHRVVRYDCPGFGRSDPRADDYRETDVLLSLVDERRLGPVALIGNSRGGRIAIDFALAHPDHVSALVLVCAAVSGYRLNASSPEQNAREEAALERRDAEAIADVAFEIWGRVGETRRIRELIVANALSDLTTAHEQGPARKALEHLEEIRAPTLVITGDRDAPPLAQLGDLLEQRISGATRARFDGSDHFPNLREPERFAQVVLDFLR